MRVGSPSKPADRHLDAATRRANLRTAAMLGALALAFYLAMLMMGLR